MRRALRLKHKDTAQDFDLELGKFISIDSQDKDFIYFEKMPDGKWRLTCSKSLVPEISNLQAFEIIRED